MKPGKWGPDKWKHFFVGIPLGTVLMLSGFYVFPQSLISASVMAFLLLLAISYGFELVSLVTGKGHPEHLDALAGIAGGLVGFIPVILWVLLN